MPIIARNKLNALITEGKARLDRPGRLSIPKPAAPKVEDKTPGVLASVQAAIDKLADRTNDAGSMALLASIENLLRQLIALSSQPRADPAIPVAPMPKQKTKWKFNIKRDAQGRLEAIDAIPIKREGD